MNDTETLETFCRENAHDCALVVSTLLGVIEERKAEFLQFCHLSAEESKRAREKKLFISVAVYLLCKHELANVDKAKEQLESVVTGYERKEDNIMTTLCRADLEWLLRFKELQRGAQNNFSGVLPLQKTMATEDDDAE